MPAAMKNAAQRISAVCTSRRRFRRVRYMFILYNVSNSVENQPEGLYDNVPALRGLLNAKNNRSRSDR
jgi:hypothetical protein